MTRKILMGAAFVLAIGSAFTTKHATRLLSAAAFTRIVDVPNQGQPCVQHGTCDDAGSIACTFSGIQLYKLNAQSACTIALNKLQ